MTINQIINQVKVDVLRGKFAIIRTPNESQPGNYVYGVLRPDSNENNLHYTNIYLVMQSGFSVQCYPEPNDFELVGLELHHPHNNVYKKYNILGGK